MLVDRLFCLLSFSIDVVYHFLPVRKPTKDSMVAR